MEAVKASHAAERERIEYHSPYNRGINNADQGEQGRTIRATMRTMTRTTRVAALTWTRLQTA